MQLSELKDKRMLRYVNKYTITIAIFMVIFLFVGEQSVWEQLKNRHRISLLEREGAGYRQAIRESQRAIESIQDPDSLERFARETYFMHTPAETVYMVEE